ncbi:MAG: ice-binding family protein [Anaerolineae bacterium]
MLNLSRWSKQVVFVGVVVCAVLLAGAFPTAGMASRPSATAPGMGTAASFAVLGGSTVTNTGNSVVAGNLGVWPGSAVTGFPPGMVGPPGNIHVADAVAQNAQGAVTVAYNNLVGQPCNFDLTGQDLGGMTLTAGVYCFSTSAQLTGALTLDAQGDAGAVFIFQIGSTLTTASNSSVKMINGGSDCNVFWQVGTSATIGTTTAFKGNILALTSITLNTGANIRAGRALARNGAVTMDNNKISITGCASPATATPTKTPGPANTQTPLPATQTLVAVKQTATAIALSPTETPGTGGGGGGGSQATSAPVAVLGATATPTVPILLPTTGGAGSDGPDLIWFVLGVGGAALVGFPLLFKRLGQRKVH